MGPTKRTLSGAAAVHPLLRRYLAEDLVRLRAAGEHRRYVASQRAGRIDPNPHQIDAVIFALKRIPEGGCILADEVGLGKTIEAGLVIAQLLAEGATRILLITPKALLGQWRQELFDLFGVSAAEWEPGLDLAAPGVFLMTRDVAGGRASSLLAAAPPFDLAVIDEAHEVFAGLYKRFDKLGGYLESSPHAQMAGRVWRALRPTPVLLLTATPIQNSLQELWGLAQFVEPTGALLGDLPTFRQVFCPGDDRQLAEGQDHELRLRLSQICQRTLRRQAQEFMKQPFVTRRAQLFEYSMSGDEKALYDDVTAYLLTPNLCAFRGNQRRLLLISFHRQMASSHRALGKSLEGVARRLERQLVDPSAADALGDELDDELSALAEELEELEEPDEPSPLDPADAPPPSPERITAELARVRGFIERARALTTDSKARALLRAVALVLERGEQGKGSGKVVIFTESLATQAYLRDLLLEHGMLEDADITLFRGTNEGPRVQQAVARWREEELVHLPKSARPTKEVLVRLALVHEFRTRSKVFISTEAGAKGLNLQFADTLVNYDLPWNPQRIEQRIGRIHRYGQKREATVINFIAKDNEAQRLTFDILSQKLELFGTVLDASDVVLHEAKGDAPETLASALAVDLEASLRRIYERARTLDEIRDELAALRESMTERRARFEDIHSRTASLIESRFDEQVRRAFKRIHDELPRRLAEFDGELDRVVTAYLDARGIPFARSQEAGRIVLQLSAHSALPEALRDGGLVALGGKPGATDQELLHLGHPLVRAAVDDARALPRTLLSVRAQLSPEAPRELLAYRGRRGRLRVVKVRYQGFEPAEELLPFAVLEGDETFLLPDLASGLFAAALEEAPVLDVRVDDEALDEAAEEALFAAHAEVSRRAQERYQATIEQIETALQDRLLVLGRRRTDALARVARAEAARDAAVGAEARTRAEHALGQATERLESLERELDRLRGGEDPEYARWMDSANARRARPPSTEVVLDAEFELT